MTKAENLRILRHYAEIIAVRAFKERMSRDKYEQCYRKIREWDTALRSSRRKAN